MNSRGYNNKRIKRYFCNIIKNDSNALAELYAYVSPFVYSVSMLYLHNSEDAKDNVQEVFIKIYNMKHDQYPSVNELSWLFTIAKNNAISYIRSHHSTVSLDNLNEASASHNDESLFEWLDVLSDLEKKIVILKISGNCTHKEISELLSIPQGTIQWRYSEALKKLRELS